MSPIRARRLLEAAAGLGIGLVVVAAALVPAVTAGVGGSTVVRGDVRTGETALPFFPVGFWSSTRGIVATTSTDSAGRFSLTIPDGVDGFAYAGSEPDSIDALWTQDGRSLVRGVIGEVAAHPLSHPLYQGWASATAKLLGGGRDLDFVLQAAGRVIGTAPSVGGVRVPVELRRLDGSVVQTLTPDRSGGFASAPVAPGDYALVATPSSPFLPTAVRVTVPAGGAVRASPPAPVAGATLSGRVTVSGRAASGVPVLLVQDGQQVGRTTTASTGAYSFTGLDAGTYDVDYGRSAVAGIPVRTSRPVAIPGVSASPSTTSSPTPAPTGTAATGTVVPIEQTADSVLPSDLQVTVDDGHDPVLQNVDLQPAAVLQGTVQGGTGDPIRVLAESTTTSQVVRAASADSAGRYRLGGLVPGTAYRIVAVTEPADGDATAMRGDSTLTVSASGSVVDVALAAPAATLSGTVSGATGGTVRVGDGAGLLRTGTIGKDGSYRVTGLPRGAFPVVVDADGRTASGAQLVRVGGSASLALAAGPQPAVFKAWFIAAGAGVPRVTGEAVDSDGDVLRIGPDTRSGHVEVQGLTPGTYAYVSASFVGTVPAEDGPWWYGAPLGTFTLHEGATADVQVALHVRAH